MNDILTDFYSGNLYSKYELESEVERWEKIVQEYIDNDVYEGDSYYQDSLQTYNALKEALDEYDEYYDSEGIFIKE